MNIKEYAKKHSEFNKLSYSISFLLIMSLYFILYLSIKDEGIFSYKAAVYINVLIYILFALSLNITAGVMGELNLGHAGFISVGAYSASILSIFLAKSITNGTILLIIVSIFGGLCGAIFGFIVSYSSIRLRGDYLAIITLAFGEIIKYIIQNLEFLGGAAGLNGIPDVVNFTNVYFIVVVSSTLMIMILISQKGRLLLSIRENEIAAENMGVNINKYKIYGFMLSAFFAGIGGSLFAHNLTNITPDKFNFVFSIEILVMVVLGGMGSITGAIVSATFLTLFNEVLRQTDQYRMFIYSLILILLMLFKKDGLLGIKEFRIPTIIENIKNLLKKVKK